MTLLNTFWRTMANTPCFSALYLLAQQENTNLRRLRKNFKKPYTKQCLLGDYAIIVEHLFPKKSICTNGRRLRMCKWIIQDVCVIASIIYDWIGNSQSRGINQALLLANSLLLLLQRSLRNGGQYYVWILHLICLSGSLADLQVK